MEISSLNLRLRGLILKKWQVVHLYSGLYIDLDQNLDLDNNLYLSSCSDGTFTLQLDLESVYHFYYVLDFDPDAGLGLRFDFECGI